MIKIDIYGGILGTTGYDSHTRSLANALYKVADCRIITQLPPDWNKHVNDAELRMLTKPERKEDYNLIITMPHQWRLFTGLGKNIGYVVWEGSNCPLSWVEEFINEKINLIFTPSSHTEQAILNTLEKSNLSKEEKEKIVNKIHIIPHGVNREIFHNQEKPKSNVFKFLCSKGWRGTNWDRGGVQYLIKAFSEEFSKDEKTELIIKLNPAYLNPAHIPQVMQQLNIGEDHPQISINCENIPFEKLPLLYTQADCFVCATRSDAFNLPGLEAMSCGLPTIQTEYGGQTDYMNDKNSLSVNYKLEQVKEDLMYEEVKWATPDMSHLKSQMRWAFENQDKIKEMGKQSEEDSKNWSWDKSAAKIISVL